MARDKQTLDQALQVLIKGKPKMEVTKLPAEEPKPGKNGFPMTAEWPKTMYIDDKKFPWLSDCKAGDVVTLIIRAKVDDLTTHDSTKNEKDGSKVSATLYLLEVGKLG